MQIPIISGIFADATPEFRTSYPLNLANFLMISGLASVNDASLTGATLAGTATRANMMTGWVRP